MGRYLVLWQMDTSKLPVNPKERGSLLTPMVAMVKQGIEMGKVKDWGAFAGEGRGYEVFEGTELELELQIQQFIPYADLTEEIVLGWIQDVVVGSYEEHVNEQIQKQIDEMANPITDPGLPWAPEPEPEPEPAPE